MSLPDPLLAPSTHAHHVSRFRQHLRLSFGPERAEVERGLDRLGEMIVAARTDSPGAQSP